VPWERKPTAPAFANYLSEVQAALLGTSWEWTIPLLERLGPDVIDVDAFCRAGPEDCDALDAWDAAQLATAGKNPVNLLLLIPGIGPKLGCYARNRMFGAWCWNRSTTPAPTRTDSPGGATLYLLSVDLPETEYLSDHEDWKPAIPKTVGADWYWVRYRKLSGGLNEGRLSVLDASGNRSGWIWAPFSTDDAATWISGGTATNLPGAPTVSSAPAWSVSSGPHGAVYTWEIRAYSATDPGLVTVTEPYTPPVLPPSPPPLPLPTREYSTIPDVGKRLDAMDMSLRWILNNQMEQLTREIIPLEPWEAPIAYANDVDIPLEPDHAGIIVQLDQTPPYASALFGSPLQLSRVGRVTFGVGGVWTDPLEIRVSPLIISKLPKGATRVRVHVTPPLTYKVQRMIQPPPLG
jgi:hypothetical protein